ncbi:MULTISPECIES: threonine/serine dehydratase [unclassified Streptomyces]|uniref:threonine ammonia-lyase n=1 Tax=unclassified Streptomyces TaxID=2593676 RepID=UPI0035DF4446
MTAAVSPQDVRLAAIRLKGHVVRTPMVPSAEFSDRVGRTVWVKAENMQHGGSFKFRGALNALLQLSSEQRSRGVIGASSGNHGVALALAGHRLNIPVTVVLPADAPMAKRRTIEHLGATIVTYDRAEGGRDALVQIEANRQRLTVIPSAEHRHVVAGAGTAAVEMLEAVPGLAAILVPVGGGGLAAGSALAAPGVEVIGVEPAVADDTSRSIRAGRQVRIDAPLTIADGLGHTIPPDFTFRINNRLLADVITVPEPAIADAMAYLWRHFGVKAEPSGAVALAGLVQTHRLPSGPIGVVVSGGNVDWDTYKSLLTSSIVRTDPYEPEPAVSLLH